MKNLIMLLIISMCYNVVFSQNLEKYLFDKVNKNMIELKDSEKSKLSSILNRKIIEKDYEIIKFNDISSFEKKEKINPDLSIVKNF